jgi:RNA polymerase sigma-70 factor (ECF subfamily)
MNSSEGVPVAACTAILPLTELSQLFGEHYRRVLRAAFRVTGNMADAEDVAQAVFLRLANAEVPVTNAASYLYRAAINGALDLLRRRKSAQTEPLESAEFVRAAGSGSSPEAEASGGELGALLRVAISELPARAGEMFFLRYVEEYGNQEIAALMGTSKAVVAVTLYNARSRLKKRLSEFERGKP